MIYTNHNIGGTPTLTGHSDLKVIKSTLEKFLFAFSRVQSAMREQERYEKELLKRLEVNINE